MRSSETPVVLNILLNFSPSWSFVISYFNIKSSWIIHVSRPTSTLSSHSLKLLHNLITTRLQSLKAFQMLICCHSHAEVVNVALGSLTLIWYHVGGKEVDNLLVIDPHAREPDWSDGWVLLNGLVSFVILDWKPKKFVELNALLKFVVGPDHYVVDSFLCHYGWLFP